MPVSDRETVLLLRAKAHELEAYAKDSLLSVHRYENAFICADIALIASLMADHIERRFPSD